MSVDLGLVSLLGADAVGQPGQRRFRIFLRSTNRSAVLWMEKEQLAGLAEALDRTLALVTDGQILRIEAQVGSSPIAAAMPGDFPRYPTYDVQIGQMRLSFDEQAAFFSLSAIPLEGMLEQEENDDDTLVFTFAQQQAQDLSIAIQVIVSAGRPVCPLCHTPLGGRPHACVKQNGHREIIQIEDGNEE